MFPLLQIVRLDSSTGSCLLGSSAAATARLATPPAPQREDRAHPRLRCRPPPAAPTAAAAGSPAPGTRLLSAPSPPPGSPRTALCAQPPAAPAPPKPARCRKRQAACLAAPGSRAIAPQTAEGLGRGGGGPSRGGGGGSRAWLRAAGHGVGPRGLAGQGMAGQGMAGQAGQQGGDGAAPAGLDRALALAAACVHPADLQRCDGLAHVAARHPRQRVQCTLPQLHALGCRAARGQLGALGASPPRVHGCTAAEQELLEVSGACEQSRLPRAGCCCTGAAPAAAAAPSPRRAGEPGPHPPTTCSHQHPDPCAQPPPAAPHTAADVADAIVDHRALQRLEAELGAAAGQRLDDARHVVADEDEAGHAAVSLHGAAQSVLGILRAWQGGPPAVRRGAERDETRRAVQLADQLRPTWRRWRDMPSTGGSTLRRIRAGREGRGRAVSGQRPPSQASCRPRAASPLPAAQSLRPHPRHGVGLVQDNDLEGRAGVARRSRAHRVGGKALDLVAHLTREAEAGGASAGDQGTVEGRPAGMTRAGSPKQVRGAAGCAESPLPFRAPHAPDPPPRCLARPKHSAPAPVSCTAPGQTAGARWQAQRLSCQCRAARRTAGGATAGRAGKRAFLTALLDHRCFATVGISGPGKPLKLMWELALHPSLLSGKASSSLRCLSQAHAAASAPLPPGVPHRLSGGADTFLSRAGATVGEK